MTKAIFNIEHGEFNKKGLLLPDDIEQIIIYEIDENSRPIKEIKRIKL